MNLSIFYFINIFVVLLLIFALIYAGSFVLNYIPGRKRKNSRLKLVEYLPLQPQIGVYIVSLDGDEYLVSVSNRSIQQLVKIEKKDFAGELKKKQDTKQ
ncbi:MAG: flagellar biosynthetic protein FliO [Candidatus Margulisbacteria bacterium]|nr:flagellar biosynthetic protein FliO [Candidatus Margulisiibacteriota bacterium]